MNPTSGLPELVVPRIVLLKQRGMQSNNRTSGTGSYHTTMYFHRFSYYALVPDKYMPASRLFDGLEYWLPRLFIWCSEMRWRFQHQTRTSDYGLRTSPEHEYTARRELTRRYRMFIELQAHTKAFPNPKALPTFHANGSFEIVEIDRCGDVRYAALHCAPHCKGWTKGSRGEANKMMCLSMD